MPDDSIMTQVVANHLCCGCGACVAICPSGALRMAETAAGYCWSAWRQSDACTGCGFCLQVCPGKGLGDAALPGGAASFEGQIRATYWAWAADSDIRAGGTSGGFVTAVLAELLGRGDIAAALVTGWDPANPLRPQTRLVRSAEEVLGAQRSRYAMSPVCQLVPELVGLGAPVAVVGLPCHLHGLDMLLKRSPQAPPVLRLGLFCDRVLSYHVADRLSHEAGVAAGDVEDFEYRHKGRNGWPGEVRVKPRGEPPRWLPRQSRMRLKAGYTPARCRLCFDKFSSLSDLACGDAYGGPVDSRGVSAVIVRTQAGEQVLANLGAAVVMRRADRTDLLKAQGLAERRRSVTCFSLAYERLQAPVSAPWPAGCRAEAVRVPDEEIDRAVTVLQEDFVLETADDAELATRLIEGRLASAAVGNRRRPALHFPGLGRLRGLWHRLLGGL